MPTFLKKVKSTKSKKHKNLDPHKIDIKMKEPQKTTRIMLQEDSDLTNDTPVKKKRLSLKNTKERENRLDEIEKEMDLTPRNYLNSSNSNSES